jgi:hypothetical protein
MQVETHHKLHHDNRPYAVASAESAAKAKARFQAEFAHGQSQLGAALKSVEDSVPEDTLVPAPKLKFDFSSKDLQVGVGKDFVGVHNHAYGQLLEKSGIPKKYADLLWQENPELLVRNLTERYHRNRADKTFLTRVVNGQLRGFLSDKFQRFDVKPMVEAFLETCQQFKAVPVQAQNLATRFYLKMVVPVIFEPVTDEVLVFGVIFRTSDYGDGAYEIRGFVRRVWCTNDGTTEDCLRQIHLGAKLTAANFSQETLGKQADMLASATRDTVKGILKPANIEKRLEVIKVADAEQIKIDTVLDRMRKGGEITKAEADRAKEILSTTDVEVLPPVREKPKKGHTSLWRFANAFSSMAGEDDTSPERAMDYENIAGKLSGLQAKKTNGKS